MLSSTESTHTHATGDLTSTSDPPEPQAEESAPPPPTTCRSTLTYPDHMLDFPREQWTDAAIGYPPFHPAEYLRRARWAARESSRRWELAFETEEMGDLETDDFVLAVFDKVDELHSHMRKTRREHRKRRRSTAEWPKATDIIIQWACDAGLLQIKFSFPDHERLMTFSDSAARARAFARSGLARAWLHAADSFGPPPEKGPLDISITDRYLPDPSTLLRPFTKMDPYDEYPDEPTVIWCDGMFREVPAPDAVSPPAALQSAATASADS